MTKFDRAVEFVLEAEGGFSDDQDDHGGTTKFGISFNFLKSIEEDRLKKYGMLFTSEDHLKQLIHDMEIETAKNIYFHEFWNSKFDEIQSNLITNHYFDTCVLSGKAQATKILQRSTWTYTGTYYALKDDGVFGTKTLNAVNDIYGDSLIFPYKSERAGFHRILCAKNPSQEKYLKGWLNRVYR